MQDHERPPRSDDFIREAAEIAATFPITPSPEKDFGMYLAMSRACEGLHEHLDHLRRNQGRIAYTAQNMMSDFSKAYIAAAHREDTEELAYLERAMAKLATGFDEAAWDGEIADTHNKFSRTIWQEQMEACLFGQIWPVITGKQDQVPDLTPWREFKGNPQSFLYGYLDVVPEMGKALTGELSRADLTTDGELGLYERYLVIADSITHRLSEERHIPGYIISNGYGRWMSYATKLRTAYGTIGHVRREYNLRRSNLRMHEASEQRIVAQVLAEIRAAVSV